MFLFAKGSTQEANMGAQLNPAVASALRATYGDKIAVQGIEFPGSLLRNFNAAGADDIGVQNMQKLLEEISVKCPNTIMAVGGYSQGAALVHAAMGPRSPAILERVKVAVTFGDTKTSQDKGWIPNFDPAKTLIICNSGDLAYNGTLVITQAHLEYPKRVPEAVSFLQTKINEAMAT